MVKTAGDRAGTEGQDEMSDARAGAPSEAVQLQNHIRELEQTRASLVQANRQLQAVLDAASAYSIIATDQDGLITMFNRGAEKMLGYRADEMVGKQTPMLIHLASEVEAREKILRADLGYEVSGFWVFVETARHSGLDQNEWTYVRKDGTHILVKLIVTPVRDEQDAITGFLGIAEDITERKRVEQELTQREELFRLLFENSGDANLLIDDAVFIDCNAATLRLLGCADKAQVIATHPADLSPKYQPDGRLSSEKANEMIQRAYEVGSHRFEWLHLRASGEELPVEVMLTAIPMHGRWIIHTAWRDLTEKKRAEAENQKLAQNLLHAQKIESIGRLAGGVAHDFNNLLTPIMGFAEMLAGFCASDPRAAQRLKNIMGAAAKARDLTRKLLAFGRKQMLEMKVVELNQVVLAFHQILERTIREDVHIHLALNPALGTILADASQIEQIIMNLAINAQDAMPAGGVLTLETGNVSLGAGSEPSLEIPPGHYVRLVVSDTGTGMDGETLAHIFEPFFTTKEEGQGTGLGLATVFGIVKQHGGHVDVSSKPGRGSTFSLYFPQLEAAMAAPSEPEPSAMVSPAREGARILLVEDNAMVRDMTWELLSDQGYTVLVAEAPDQALRMIEECDGEVDLLLSDVVMPGMSGPELYQLLLERHPGLKVLFMSGYSEELMNRQHGLGAESGRVLQKPFSVATLNRRIEESLRS